LRSSSVDNKDLRSQFGAVLGMLGHWWYASLSWLWPCLVSKKFQDSPSHRILWHMHGVLNIDKTKYWLHSLPVIRELNLLSLVSPW
jgi:hypothetical protein